MSGTESLEPCGKFFVYECECGEITEYGTCRYADTDEYYILSCCGQCAAAQCVRFCPFCGAFICLKRINYIPIKRQCLKKIK